MINNKNKTYSHTGIMQVNNDEILAVSCKPKTQKMSRLS